MNGKLFLSVGLAAAVFFLTLADFFVPAACCAGVLLIGALYD